MNNTYLLIAWILLTFPVGLFTSSFILNLKKDTPEKAILVIFIMVGSQMYCGFHLITGSQAFFGFKVIYGSPRSWGAGVEEATDF